MGDKVHYLEKISHSSVVQRVIDALTGAMISRQLRPGDRIPTELELTEQLGVGRMSIREAVKVLVYFGVLEIRRPEGTFVREGFVPEMLDPMLYGIILDTDGSYDSLKELREMMEVGSIKIAILKATEQDTQRLLEAYNAFAKAISADPVNIQDVFDADDAFHACVSDMGKNPMISKINSLVRKLTYVLRYKTVSNMVHNGQVEVLLAAHKDIYDAIYNKDPQSLDEIVHKGYFYDQVQEADSY